MSNKNAHETDSIDISDSLPTHPPRSTSQRASAVPASASKRLSSVSARRTSSRQPVSPSSTSTRGKLPVSTSTRRSSVTSSRASVSKRMVFAPTLPYGKKLVVGIILGIIVPIVLIIGLVRFLRPDESNLRAGAAADEGTKQLTFARESLSANRAAEALKAIENGQKIIAVAAPLDPRLAERLSSLKSQFATLQEEARTMSQDLMVQENHRQLTGRFARLPELDSAALDLLEKQCLAFLTNPVSPGAEANPSALTTYQKLVSDVQRLRDSIGPARKNIEDHYNAEQSAAARSEITVLVRQERFQAALDLLTTYRTKCPQGRFDDLQAYIDNASKRTWEAVKVFAESRIQDAQSAGLPAERRKKAYAEARQRLQEATERFGIPEQLEAASVLLQRIPAE